MNEEINEAKEFLGKASRILSENHTRIGWNKAYDNKDVDAMQFLLMQAIAELDKIKK